MFSTEKSLEDLGDKIPADEKANIQSKLDAAKEALKGEDMDRINSTSEDLKNAFYAAYENVMKQTQGAAGAAGANYGPADNASTAQGDVYDADFTDVDDK